MNTQRQVFEKLAKQNLGAIEDAVQVELEAMNVIETKIDTILQDIQNILSDGVNKLSQEVEVTMQLVGNKYTNFENLKEEWYSKAEQFDALNISYNEDNLNSLSSSIDNISETPDIWLNTIANNF